MTKTMETELNYVQITGGFRVPKNDTHISKWQIESEPQSLAHAPWLAQLVCDRLPPDGFLIDGGAYDGDHSIQYSLAMPRGMIIAVEAGSLAFSCLAWNVTLFQNKNTYALHSALSDIDGTSVSHTSDPNLGASTCQIVPDNARIPGNKYLLTTTVDTLVHKAEKPLSFLKLDIEGYELRALLGASKTLKRDRPGLLLEINDSALTAQGDSAEDIYQLLNAFSYDWEICEKECTLASPQYNIICKPKPTDSAGT